MRKLAILFVCQALIFGACSGAAPDATRAAPDATPAAPALPGVPYSIAFASDREVLIMSMDGAGQRIVTNNNQCDSAPVWSPDGAFVAFTGADGIFVVDADGGNLRQLTQEAGYHAVWSPDSARIALTDKDYDDRQDRQIYVVDADGGNLRQLTQEAGYHAVWSPDSARIAFTDNHIEVSVVDADGGNLRQLTDDDDDWDYHPVWSPDGTRIAFTRRVKAEVAAAVEENATTDFTHSGLEIMVMDADGANPGRLVDNISWTWTADGYSRILSYGPVWSPDGSRIAFTGDFGNEIAVVQVEDGGMRQLFTHVDEDTAPMWSPNGARIAFTSDRKVFVIDANGENIQQLTGAAYQAANPVWSPDSVHIAFTGSSENAPVEIYVVDADGDNFRRITQGGGFAPVWLPAIEDSLIATTSPPPVEKTASHISYTRDRYLPGIGPIAEVWAIDVESCQAQQLSPSDWDFGPVWSPDGARIAFTSDLDGDFEIFVMDADGGNVRQLTHNDWWDYGPVWSSDGAWIAFNGARDDNYQETEIFVVDTEGRNVRQLGRGHDPRWSPNGFRIAFERFRKVYVMNAEGGAPQEVTEEYDFGDSPAWSPDGARIVYINTGRGIYVVDAEGGNQQQLTDTSSLGRDDHPVWSPDGTRIAFTRSDDRDVWVMDADGANQQALTGAVYPDDLRWSPDGARIAFTNDHGIFVVDVDDGNVRQLTQDGGYGPVWSPDGARIAFTNDREVWLIDAGGANLRNLTNNNQWDGVPVWSPDGTQMALAKNGVFIVHGDGGDIRQITQEYFEHLVWSPDSAHIALTGGGYRENPIFVVDADDGALRQIADNNFASSPAWSPDSARIAFTTGGEIWAVDADGANLQQLTRNDDRDFKPAWSPDGARIAFTRVVTAELAAALADEPEYVFEYEHTAMEVIVIDANGANERRLVDNIYRHWSDMVIGDIWSYGPVWSPDGTLIAFHGDDGYEVAVVDVDGANLIRRLSDLPVDRDTPLVWSPDGGRLAFTSGGEVFVVDEDGTNLRQVTLGGGFNPVWLPATE